MKRLFTNLFSLFSLHSLRSAQVMIITVLTLGGTILGATTIAGLLMLYQIRQATDLASSAKAIFAADAGIEWASYQFFCDSDPANPWPGCTDSSFTDPPGQASSPFDNAAKFEVTCYKDLRASQPISCPVGKSNQSDPALDQILAIKSIGRAGNTSRAFLLTFQ